MSTEESLRSLHFIINQTSHRKNTPTSNKSHCCHPSTQRQIPFRCNPQPPAHNLSWFPALHRTATLQSILGRRRLERFWHHIWFHIILYFCPSHHFKTSLQSLLTLNYVPWKLKFTWKATSWNCSPSQLRQIGIGVGVISVEFSQSESSSSDKLSPSFALDIIFPAPPSK